MGTRQVGPLAEGIRHGKRWQGQRLRGQRLQLLCVPRSPGHSSGAGPVSRSGPPGSERLSERPVAGNSRLRTVSPASSPSREQTPDVLAGGWG